MCVCCGLSVIYRVILQRFIAKIDAKDYDRGFTEAFIILSSYKSDEDDKIKEVVARKVNEEVEKYVNSDVNDVVLSNVNELMRNINEFNSDLQLPEDVINVFSLCLNWILSL